ncbi:hypothetical protein [Actinacidiphila sp. ITFR-21]|uniref:hypothetical protein n=1 Tax=Actinacidiphila sp. ITFR-21 TaxID=3075199 RepID=UPI00288A9562|nr:hypothetical protein [Streptomyces sp. ITFR-21]WNI15226.1 hypothetical protein RLT57_06535 [Streptomyces sp. ITFR-21]
MADGQAPDGLEQRGSELWEAIASGFELRQDELRVLEDACREADLIERLHQAHLSAPLVVTGSMGQPVASPLVQELRAHRALLARLLGTLKLPDDDERQASDGQRRTVQARKAAMVRWGNR